MDLYIQSLNITIFENNLFKTPLILDRFSKDHFLLYNEILIVLFLPSTDSHC